MRIAMKKTALLASIGLLGLALGMVGCQSTYPAKPVRAEEIDREGNVVFVRPSSHPWLGTVSLRDYVRITHDEARQNPAGLLEVNIGLRNFGGGHWWDTRGPDFPLSVKTAFYDRPYNQGGGRTSPVLYETNWETVKLLRGATIEYKATCPVKSAKYYQVTISELVGTASY
jgi:hypothetical protein